MKSIYIICFLIGWHSFVLGQCQIANDYLDVADSTIVHLGFDGTNILSQERHVCLAGGILQDDLPCLPDDRQGISVWYKITSPENVGTIYSAVRSNTKERPVWKFYFEATDGQIAAVGRCSDRDPLEEILSLDFSWENNYFIHIQIPFEEAPTSTDSLHLKLFLSPYAERTPCSNVTTTGESLEPATVTIVQRENSSLPNNLIVPGERLTVEVRLTVEMQDIEAGNLHSLIPMLGAGWDHNYFYSVEQYAYAETSAGDWITNRDDCRGNFNVGSDLFCSYLDEEDHVRICNKLVEYCPCEGSISPGDLQPAGWYFTKQGILSGCANTCKPSEQIASIGNKARVLVRMKLRASTGINSEDLSIRILPTEDYFTGCHPEVDRYCSYQVPIVLNPYQIIKGEHDYFILDYPWTVCNRENIELSFTALGLTENQIQIDFVPHTNIGGLPSSPITLNQEIYNLAVENFSDEIETVEFYASAVTTAGVQLDQGPYQIEILPDHKLLEDVFEICINACDEITLKTNWENRKSLNFDWSTGQTGETILACDSIDYTVTITDNDNCSEIVAAIYKEPKLVFPHEIESDEAFCDFSPSASYKLTVDPENPPLSIKWHVETAVGIIFEHANSTQFTVPSFLLSTINEATIVARVFAFGGCEVELRRDVEIFHPETNRRNLLFCSVEINEPVYKNIRLDLNQGSTIIDVSEVMESTNITSIWVGGDSLVLEVIPDEFQSETYSLRLKYENGCQEIFHYDIQSYSIGSAEIIHDVVDFEVDFEITFPQVADSILWSFGDGTYSTELFPSKIYSDIGTYEVEVSLYTNCAILETLSKTVYIGGTATDNSILPGLSVYPNPATNSLTIEGLPIDTKCDIVIHDLMGKIIAKDAEVRTSNYQIDVSNFAIGTYLLIVTSSSGQWQEKIVVVND